MLDVDKALQRPSIVDLAEAISRVSGVEGLNITVTEIDVETIGMDITIEGTQLDYDGLVRAIEHTGAVVHSIDELVAGDRFVEAVRRKR